MEYPVALLRGFQVLAKSVPKGKVASLMGVLNYLQSKFNNMVLNLFVDDGSISQQDYEDKIKEAFRQMGVGIDEN